MEGILLNIHVETVKEQLNLRTVQFPDKVRTLLGCVQKILFITVYDFQAVVDIIILRYTGQFPQRIQASLSGLHLIVIRDRPPRPTGV